MALKVDQSQPKGQGFADFAYSCYNYTRSAVAGVASGVALAAMWPFDLESKNPTADQCTPFQTPILLIHGFMGSSNNWAYHIKKLEDAGYTNIFTVNMGHIFKTFDDEVDKIHAVVKVIQERTGRNDLNIIGHSAGAIRAIAYRQKYGDQVRVRKIQTLGGPIDGTKIAKLASSISPLAEAMLRGSDFLTTMHTGMANDTMTHYYHLASTCDYFMWPGETASSSHAPNTEVKTIDTGHIPLLFSPTASDWIINNLDKD